MIKKRYWIGVACKDQVMIGVKGGFAQLQHGRKILLQEMNQGNWFIISLPRLCSNSLEGSQSFMPLNTVASQEVYAFDMGTGSLPHQLDGDFALCQDSPILPMSDKLSFIEDKKSWGYPFRLGHLEIGEEDFELLVEEMDQDEEVIKH